LEKKLEAYGSSCLQDHQKWSDYYAIVFS
jgi:hypothetical protein